MKNNKDMNLYIDYDATLNDLPFKWIKWVNGTYNTNYKFEDINRWEFFQELNTQYEVTEYFKKNLPYTSGNYEVKPIQGSIDFFDEVSRLYNTTILTSTKDEKTKTFKDQHIYKYYGISNVIHTYYKYDFAINDNGKPNILIDDKLESCLMFVANGGIAILFNYENMYNWNRIFKSIDGLFLASSYDGIQDILRILYET